MTWLLSPTFHQFLSICARAVSAPRVARRRYLPKRAADQFKKAWEGIVGRKYANTKMELDAATIKKLPTVSFVFEDGVTVDVLPSAYMERSGSKYVPRIYLTEGSGAVLGGNFMQDHDVRFASGYCRCEWGVRSTMPTLHEDPRGLVCAVLYHACHAQSF